MTDTLNMPIRVQLMLQGIALTNGARDKEYGDPRINLQCAGELKQVMRKFIEMSGKVMPLSELEALDMVCTKISRILCGGNNVKPDTYIDGSTYFAIAGEQAIAYQAEQAMRAEASDASEKSRAASRAELDANKPPQEPYEMPPAQKGDFVEYP